VASASVPHQHRPWARQQAVPLPSLTARVHPLATAGPPPCRQQQPAQQHQLMQPHQTVLQAGLIPAPQGRARVQQALALPDS